MIEVNVADLTWAPFIYPRGGRNEETVKSYVEALRIGAKFPPIKIQRVFNYPGDNVKKMGDGLSRNRISEIIGNANFSEIDTLLSHGRDMNHIAGHYHLDAALAWVFIIRAYERKRSSEDA